MTMTYHVKLIKGRDDKAIKAIRDSIGAFIDHEVHFSHDGIEFHFRERFLRNEAERVKQHFREMGDGQ